MTTAAATVGTWSYERQMAHAAQCARKLMFFHGIVTDRRGKYEVADDRKPPLAYARMIEIAEQISAEVVVEMSRGPRTGVEDVVIVEKPEPRWSAIVRGAA